MADLNWYINRLRAMDIQEILWRISQKRLARSERKTFGKQHIRVTDGVFYDTGNFAAQPAARETPQATLFAQNVERLAFHGERLHLPKPTGQAGEADAAPVRAEQREGADTPVKSAKETAVPDNTDVRISLPGGYDYHQYKKDWHAGFQTDAHWPLEFSYALRYKQRDDIGDARTNWELNRHFQFAQLACFFSRTGNPRYLTELSDLFADWNEKNPFLQGISWTSVMEIAIRDINWIYTLGFLTQASAQLADRCAGRERAESHAADGRADGEWTESPGADGCTPEAMQARLLDLREQLRVGIINMTVYISGHYSRFSSANNHVIVEAAAMGIAGIVMGCEEWLDESVAILNREIPRQNYSDGVNKEMSLHYQSFFMEAVGLLGMLMQTNGIRLPQLWRNTLTEMSRYLSDCQGQYGETVVFGDDDEGKILDLAGTDVSGGSVLGGVTAGNGAAGDDTPDGGESGGVPGGSRRSHYLYVLQLMSMILPERYVERITDQTLLRLIASEKMTDMSGKPYYRSTKSVCYEEGGVSLLKSGDGRMLIGIDHGALGFGSIAAHGHADALSFQMYLDGQPVFADAGTYIYHTDLDSRNAFRKTENHNTITVNGKDQSEMLGAFLWGKRAETTLLSHNLAVGNCRDGAESRKEAGRLTGAESRSEETPRTLHLEAEHDGYAPVIHRRRFAYEMEKNSLMITDRLLHVENVCSWELNFLLGDGCTVMEEDGGYMLSLNGVSGDIRLSLSVRQTMGMGNLRSEVLPAYISMEYGSRRRTQKLRITGTAATQSAEPGKKAAEPDKGAAKSGKRASGMALDTASPDMGSRDIELVTEIRWES